MLFRSPFRFALLCLGLVVLASPPASAQAPWSRLALFRRVAADPNTDYGLTRENGPWMIMAATFAGEGAEDQARELTYELRKSFKLEAYTYKMQVDAQEETVNGRGVDRYGQPLRMRYRRKSNNTEIAVLVGNYPSVDDSQAQRELVKVKEIEPKTLNVEELARQGKRTYQQLVGFRLNQKNVTPEMMRKNASDAIWHNTLISNSTRQWGPMGSAFLSRNPALPDETAVNTIDKFVYDMNKEVEHSLLDCRGKYSVRVATFTGSVVLNQKAIRELQRGDKKMKSRLAYAAEQTHRLTVALRQKGYEAYEFHDRGASMVTVGSFNTLGTPRPDGKLELDPRIVKIMQTFGRDEARGGQPRSLIGIPFDVNAVPVLVPVRSFAADYARGS